MSNMLAFRFSPRPNRAHEIVWHEFGEAAFAEAERRNIPVLLSISAVWCHWCHVMDERTYSDASVIETINRDFLPVRVDTDRRPDVNTRYNMGGWPTTAVLTPSGAIITGATYIPPTAMMGFLERVSTFYTTQKDAITTYLKAAPTIASSNATSTSANATSDRGTDEAYEVGTISGEGRTENRAAEASLDPMIVAKTLRAIESHYDERFGGFGDAPKFPHFEALELLCSVRATGVREHARSGRGDIRPGITSSPGAFVDMILRYERMVRTTVEAMMNRELFDHVEGGYFRYATSADWTTPHYEKLALDQARHLTLLVHASKLSPETFHTACIAAAQQTLGYIRGTLYDPELHVFAGSQDADEDYFVAPAAQRKTLAAPFVDPTSYIESSAALASACARAGFEFDDPGAVVMGMRVLDTLHATATYTSDAMPPTNVRSTQEIANDEEPSGERVQASQTLVVRCLDNGRPARERGMLIDQVSYLRALLALHQISGEPRFFERARSLANAITRNFARPDGAYVDRVAQDAVGALAREERPPIENAALADAFTILARMANDADLERRATRILAAISPKEQTIGVFSASYCIALSRVSSVGTVIRIVGTPDQSRGLREAAAALPDPMTVVRAISPDDTEALAEFGLPAETAAYLCRGNTCAPASFTAEALTARFHRLEHSAG